MTGIFGYFAKDINEYIIHEMIEGIENEGYAVIDKVITHTSLLGKLDIKKSIEATKSIISKDRVNIITCGEIYNEDIEDINKSILTLYEEGKLNLLKEFNGSFAAAIYDNFKEKLTLVNDRYGLIKLFYSRKNECFCFAPKIGPLLRIVGNKTLRKDAIIDFFQFGYLLGDKTFFEQIYQLPPASILEITGSDMDLTKYWDYEYDEEYGSRSQEVLIDELGTLWQRAVERRIKKDEQIIIPISGGLDSRAILAAALKCTSKDNIITCTFGEEGSFDFEIGKMVAKKAGVKNIPLGIEKEHFENQYNLYFGDTEGMCDATPIFPPNKYSKLSQFGNKIISGYLGDALMGDHITETISKIQVDSYESLMEYRKLLINIFAFNGNNDKEIKGILNKKNFDDYYSNANFNESLKKTYKKNNNLSNIIQKWEFNHLRYKYEMTNVLRFRHLFNYCCPICDNELVDFMLKIPPELRAKENLYKQMVIKKYPELFELPTKTNSGLRLDVGITLLFIIKGILFLKRKANKISNRLIKKNMFQDKTKNYIDYDELLRNNDEYRNYMRKMIERVKMREYFNKEYIQELWRLHMRGCRNYSMLLGLLVTFELFLEGFVDEA